VGAVCKVDYCFVPVEHEGDACKSHQGAGLEYIQEAFTRVEEIMQRIRREREAKSETVLLTMQEGD